MQEYLDIYFNGQKNIFDLSVCLCDVSDSPPCKSVSSLYFFFLCP